MWKLEDVKYPSTVSFGSIFTISKRYLTVREQIWVKLRSLFPFLKTKNVINKNTWLYYYCKTCFFSRASIFRDFHDLNSIREKYTIVKISMLIILIILGPFWCFFGLFRVFAIFCRSLLFALSRKIHAHENFGQPFANNRLARNIPVLQYIYMTVVHYFQIASVDKLCWMANNSLKRREEYEKLEAVRKTIDPYEAIEAPNDECSKVCIVFGGVATIVLKELQNYKCSFVLCLIQHCFFFFFLFFHREREHFNVALYNFLTLLSTDYPRI